MYSCILFFSLINGIDPVLTQSVIHVESKGNPQAVGSIGEVGLMQIRPEFVPETSLQLFNPCTNVRVGIRLLKSLNPKYGPFDKSWINCYNLGRTACKKVRFPKKFRYYKKVIAAYENPS